MLRFTHILREMGLEGKNSEGFTNHLNVPGVPLFIIVPITNTKGMTALQPHSECLRDVLTKHKLTVDDTLKSTLQTGLVKQCSYIHVHGRARKDTRFVDEVIHPS